MGVLPLFVIVCHFLDGRQLSAQELLVDLVVLRCPRLKLFHLANELCKIEILKNITIALHGINVPEGLLWNVHQPPRFVERLRILCVTSTEKGRKESFVIVFSIKDAVNRGVTQQNALAISGRALGVKN